MVNHGKPSLMWNYFTQRNKDEAICNICSKIYGTKGSSTSTLKKHLAIHKEEYEEYSLNQAERDRAYSAVKDKKNVNKAEDLSGKTFKQLRIDETLNFNDALKERQQEFDDAIVDWVAETGIAFNVVGTPSFKKLINIANRKLVVKTPKTISKHVEKRSVIVLSDVHDIINAVKSTVPSIGFTTDMWTSLAGDSYCSLTTSFIDKDF